MQHMITVFDPACGAPVVFDNPQLALAFVRMLAESITPLAWVDAVQQIMPSLTDVAKQLADTCMGGPA